MDKVKKLIKAGASVPTAIKEALGMELQEFAAKYDLSRPMVSAVINGDRRATGAIVAAFATELGGTEQEWRMLFWETAKPQPQAEVA
jgi:plasmid maintenance system antidote protein VapI